MGDKIPRSERRPKAKDELGEKGEFIGRCEVCGQGLPKGTSGDLCEECHKRIAEHKGDVEAYK